ncbi:MAG TPA: glycosyltransferase [Bryobacteraceae bacterium]|nr:glycosyltransferase [Bryobacteraceae bacterium]
MSSKRRISVVVISRDEGPDLRTTVENLEDTLPADAEIVVVDDGSIDGSADYLATRRKRVRLLRSETALGVAKARLLGAAKTSGDVIIFADAHLGLDRDWWQPLVEPLEDPKVGATAPTITNLPVSAMRGYGLTFRGPAMEVRWCKRKPKGPAAAAILPGCCVAMRRDALEATGGGWDSGLLERGNVDNEFSLRLWLLGYELLVVPEILVRHRFRPISPFPVGWPKYLHNRLRLAFIHFKPQRLGRVVASLRGYPSFGKALTLVVDGDIASRRREISARRVRDDDWYFDRFRLKW